MGEIPPTSCRRSYCRRVERRGRFEDGEENDLERYQIGKVGIVNYVYLINEPILMIM